MSKELEEELLYNYDKVEPILKHFFSCKDSEIIGCKVKPKTPSPVKPKTPSPVKPKTPSPTKKRKRCPKGTRKNKKTGNCESTTKKSISVKPKTPSPVKPKTPSPVKPKTPSPEEKRKRCPKGTRKNKKTGKCESTTKKSISAKPKTPSPEKKRKRCPKGTHKNKKTGKCESIRKSISVKPKTPSPVKPKTPSPVKPKTPSPVKPPEKTIPEIIIELRDMLHNAISEATSKIETYGESYLTRSEGILLKDKFKDGQLALKQLVEMTKQVDEYKELIHHSFEYHLKKNQETHEETPDSVLKKMKTMIQEARFDKTKIDDKIFVKNYKQLRKKLNSFDIPYKNTYIYIVYMKHTLKYWLKDTTVKKVSVKKQTVKKQTVKKQTKSDACNRLSICQYSGSCWFVSIFLMFAKVKPLYRLLHKHHQNFVDGLLVCQRKDMGNYCKLPPPDIWKSYRKKHRENVKLHKYYKSKDSIKLDEAFDVGGFAYLLFSSIMNLNNIFNLHYSIDLDYNDISQKRKNINKILKDNYEACQWLQKNYHLKDDKKKKREISFYKFLTDNGILDYAWAFNDIITKVINWPTESDLKKGICFRQTIDFANNNFYQEEKNPKYLMRLPEFAGIKNRDEWKLKKNWLSEIAEANPSFIGGWLDIKYPEKVKIDGKEHAQHSTSFSVCRDDPKNIKINICNTWGARCSYGASENPWFGWNVKDIILERLEIIQYFPPI